MNTPLWSATSPGVDCLRRGHITVTLTDRRIPCKPGEVATARWCLWCGAGSSNEHEAGWGAGAAKG